MGFAAGLVIGALGGALIGGFAVAVCAAGGRADEHRTSFRAGWNYGRRFPEADGTELAEPVEIERFRA
jgi:hypothetical protein